MSSDGFKTPADFPKGTTWRFLLAILACFVLPIVVASVFARDWRDTPLGDAALDLAFYGLAGLWLWFVWIRHLPARALLGERIVGREAAVYLALGVPLVAASIFFIYLLYIPLSYVAPDFVQSYLLERPEALTTHHGAPLVVHALEVLRVVVAVPILEEIVFRGFLFERWRHQRGTVFAVVLSSSLFGVLHTDVLGAAVVGAFLCLVRLRTGSLVGPILAHAGNNALAVIAMFALPLVTGSETADIAELQTLGTWVWPIGAALVAGPWLWWFTRTRLRIARDGLDLDLSRRRQRICSLAQRPKPLQQTLHP